LIVRRRGPVVAAIVVAVALAVVAAGCSSDDGGSSGAEGTSSTTTAPRSTSTSTTTLASTLHAGDHYVALGSSIASGFGISEQSTDCGRSSRDYGQLIAARFHLELTDVSCGAATIPNVVDTPQGAHPPQITALTADTKLVTVSVGGNDINYNGTAVVCGDPASECTAPPGLDANVAKTGPALRAMVQAIEDAAPSAIIVFVTYPREVPDGNCPDLGFTDAEAAVVREMGERLEQVFVDFSQAEKDVVFVDPYAAPGDHTGCAAAAERWTAGHVADDGFAYHPTALGHEVMARMIAEALGRSGP
jgi:lysophospholipase L1-like esterase